MPSALEARRALGGSFQSEKAWSGAARGRGGNIDSAPRGIVHTGSATDETAATGDEAHPNASACMRVLAGHTGRYGYRQVRILAARRGPIADRQRGWDKCGEAMLLSDSMPSRRIPSNSPRGASSKAEKGLAREAAGRDNELHGKVTGLSYRERLLDGLRQSIRERGYRETQITHIVGHAKTSRRTFYAEFSTKEECFAALLNQHLASMIERIPQAIDSSSAWPAQVEQGIRAYISLVAEDPALFRSYIRELSSLGAMGQKLHREGMNQLTTMALALSQNPKFRERGEASLDRELVAFLLGGIFELVVTVFESGGNVLDLADKAVRLTSSVLGIGSERVGAGRKRR